MVKERIWQGNGGRGNHHRLPFSMKQMVDDCRYKIGMGLSCSHPGLTQCHFLTYLSSIKHNNRPEDKKLIEILTALFVGASSLDLDGQPLMIRCSRRIPEI